MNANPRRIGAVVAALAISFGAITPAQAVDLDGFGKIGVPPIAGGEVIPGYPIPVQHPGAPVPQPFPADALVGYISDISSHDYGIYYSVVDGFKDLQKNHPEVMHENLEKVVKINNDAASNPALIHRAQIDAAADKEGLLSAFSDALGSELGQYFRDALKENRLPKTVFLFGNGYGARAGGLASSTFFEKEIFAYDRPFKAAPERIKRYENGKDNFYRDSKSFPSGHTNQATWVTTLLALAIPELGPQLLARGSEAGYNRLVMGVHYPLDVMGGRMTGTAAAADRWNDLRMRAAIKQAGEEIRKELEWRAGRPLSEVVAHDTPYRSTTQAVKEYTERMSMGFAPVYKTDAPMIVPQAAPDLLLPSHPTLNYAQRASILRQTAIKSGSPLDDQGPRGSWQRLNIAAAMAANVKVNPDGSVTVI
ncbi:acid phosphatase [Corynebacterium anserum]|uniref:acid phosphatase n=1 Tax=Corynebacterium anserum TaxID=2684406 RepID=UPI001FE2AB0C|nr:phosphatase PAP2 family protein [Corynebacterium anserum]